MSIREVFAGCDYQTETHVCGRQAGHTSKHYLLAKFILPTTATDAAIHALCVRLAQEYCKRNLPDAGAMVMLSPGIAAAFEPTIKTLVEALEDGERIIKSAYSHVSHGGPTREEAAEWIEKAHAALDSLRKDANGRT